MTGVVIKRKCENCGFLVDQWAFFKEDENEKVILEKWQERCSFCKKPLKKPTEEELRNALLINQQMIQNQFTIMQSQLLIQEEIRNVARIVQSNDKQFTNLRQNLEGLLFRLDKFLPVLEQTAILQVTQNALIKGLSNLEKTAESYKETSQSLTESSKSFKKSMDEHMKLLGVFKKGVEFQNKQFREESKHQTKLLNEGFVKITKAFCVYNELVKQMSDELCRVLKTLEDSSGSQ